LIIDWIWLEIEIFHSPFHIGYHIKTSILYTINPFNKIMIPSPSFKHPLSIKTLFSLGEHEITKRV